MRDNPEIYHIVHYDRLASIVRAGGLFPNDYVSNNREQCAGTSIGMAEIKNNRLSMEVSCHAGLKVGSCVPFNFSPRSVMLYVISQRNHQELAYRGGQAPIVHLEGQFDSTIAWAEQNNKRWAFTTKNASSCFSQCFKNRAQLSKISWSSVDAREWSSTSIKEQKQAEFLIEGFCPWELVRRIGVFDADAEGRVRELLASALHQPQIEIKRDWYY